MHSAPRPLSNKRVGAGQQPRLDASLAVRPRAGRRQQPYGLDIDQPFTSYRMVPVPAVAGRLSSPLVEFTPPRSWGGWGGVAGAGWLAACVPSIVRQCSAGDGAFLQLVMSRPKLGYLSLPVPTTMSEQRWRSLQSAVAARGADAVVLVHPIAPPPDHSTAAPSSADGQRRSGSATAVLRGKVGEVCCDGEGAHSHPAHASAHLGGAHASAAGSSSSSPASDDGSSSAQYYGLVVQGQASSSRAMCATAAAPAACYVLKTHTSDDAVGCLCTHWSLTRISQGQPLWRQVHDSWRV